MPRSQERRWQSVEDTPTNNILDNNAPNITPPENTNTEMEMPNIEYHDNATTEFEPTPATEEPAPALPAVEPTNVRRSGRVHQQTKAYQPTIIGKKYEYVATQLVAQRLSDKLHCDVAKHEFDSRVVQVVMTQLSLKAAIKAWGNQAKVAAEAEMRQLHWWNTFKPIHWKDLTPKQ